MATATRPFSGTFVVDSAHSSIMFAVKHMGLSLFRAWFTEFDARLVANDDGVVLTGTAPVESVSIKMPQELREHVVYGGDFFDARNYPQIRVVSTELRFAPDGTLIALGELTLRGLTRPVSASGRYRHPVPDPFGSTRAALEIAATIDRRDWGMDWQAPLPSGGDALGNLVEITGSLELVQEG